MTRLHPHWLQLGERFASGFDERLDGPRTVGREAEFPVVTETGELADVRELLPALAAPGDLVEERDRHGQLVSLTGPRFTYALEVGLGTLELITGPCADLWSLRACHTEGLERLVDAAGERGWRVLGLGMQPLAAPSPAIMTPKPRYGVLHEVIGDGWLWFCLTASDQVHVDVARSEALAASDLGNLLVPVTVALCANSSVQGGAATGWCSTREARMGEIGASHHRHGMPPGPSRGFADYVARLGEMTFLLDKPGGVPRAVGVPFADWIADHGPDFEAFLLHEHYIWNSARPRHRQGTVELRAACQQPPDSPHAAAALHLGLVEARPALEALLRRHFGDDPWTPLRRWHAEVVRDGLAAPEPIEGLLASVLEACGEALAVRGRGEERELDPLWDRLERRENPAQEARRILDTAGLEVLLDRRTFRRA